MFFAFPVFSGHGRVGQGCMMMCACMIQFQCRAVVVLVVLLVNVESVLQLQIDTFLRLCVNFCYYWAATYLYLIVTLQRCWWCQKIESYLGTRHAKALRRSVLVLFLLSMGKSKWSHARFYFSYPTLPYPTFHTRPTTSATSNSVQLTISSLYSHAESNAYS